MELIKIYKGTLVNARDLWQFLEIKTEFSHWIKRMLDYGFESGSDYFTDVKKDGRHKLKEYYLTIGVAKEISMLQRSDKGREARKYFIQCEEALIQLKENKRFAAFTELETTKLKFQEELLSRGLDESQYIEIDTAGQRVLMNGEVIDDALLEAVLIKARDLATKMTHYQTSEKNLRESSEIKDSNVQNHDEVRNALLNQGIVPEKLPKKDDIKKLNE